MNSLTILIVAVSVALSQCSKVEQDVISKLMTGYDNRVRPSSDPDGPVVITINTFLQKLTNIDEAKGEAHLGLLISMAWTDSRLTWDKKPKMLRLPSKQVWVPDMMLYTGDGVVEKALRGNDDFDLTVTPKGEVAWAYDVNQRIPCIYTTEKLGLQCSFSIDSWAQTNDVLKVKLGNNTIDTSLMGTYHDKNYNIKSTAMGLRISSYPDAPEDKFDLVKGNILLEKKQPKNHPQHVEHADD